MKTKTNNKQVKETSKETTKAKASNFLFNALQIHPEASRTLKNKNKFSSDVTPQRAYALAEGVIKEEGLTIENAFDKMTEGFKKNPLDINKKDIKKVQRYFASLCCKACNASRSTSTLVQDLKPISNKQNRQAIKEAFPSFDDNILDVIFKATYTPSRTK